MVRIRVLPRDEHVVVACFQALTLFSQPEAPESGESTVEYECKIRSLSETTLEDATPRQSDQVVINLSLEIVDLSCKRK